MEAVLTCVNCRTPLDYTPAALLDEQPQACPLCQGAAWRRLLTQHRAAQWLTGWFLARYAVPQGLCPYDAQQRGYRFIFGGPYNAEDELLYHWHGVFTDVFLQGVASWLCHEYDCTQWSGPREPRVAR